ncbi:MAG: hypothetical protein EOP06_12685 [Proteobacteria bacterium]|nr:MAG: hypothetical protein EOP06_12685 [Pseudomonadota bacterium]
MEVEEVASLVGESLVISHANMVRTKDSRRLQLTIYGLAGTLALSFAFPAFAQDPMAAVTKKVSPEGVALHQRAEAALKAKRYAEAGILFDDYLTQQNITLQDYVGPYIQVAESWANAQRYDEAVKILERGIAIPAAPGAQPPGMWDLPKDYRGSMRWQQVEYRHAQGHWKEALEIFEANKETCIPGDGCVNGGFGYQYAMVIQGDCLEHLGRYREAIEGYWEAAAYLQGDSQPIALRRLIDIYTAQGRMEVLFKAIELEKKALFSTVAYDYQILREKDLSDDQKEGLAIRAAMYPIFQIAKIAQLRQAARDHDWNKLLPLLESTSIRREVASPTEVSPNLISVEAIAALMLVKEVALPQLKVALERTPQSPYLQAAVLACSTPFEEREAILKQTLFKNTDTWLALRFVFHPLVKPLDISQIKPHQLPTKFKAVNVLIPAFYEVKAN